MEKNNIQDEAEFLENLHVLQAAVSNLASENQETAYEGARRFMRAIYKAGRAINTHPQWAQLTGWESFIGGSAPIILRNVIWFSRFHRQTTDLLEREWEWGEEWIEVCRNWSSAQFARELYGGKLGPEFDIFSEDDEYLEDLRAQGEKHGPLRPQDIPEGIPPSHWWWWYPNPPGNAQAG